MEDVVAVRVALASGDARFFLTWGRVHDSVDSTQIEKAVLAAANKFDLGGEPISAVVCSSLRDASSEPYFYEAFFKIAQRRVPYGRGYKNWAAAMRDAVDKGREVYYLGRSKP